MRLLFLLAFTAAVHAQPFELKPNDVIALTGSLPIDDARYARQLAIGGRLFAVIGQGAVMEATLIERVSADEFRRTVLFETSLKALVGAAEPARFTF